MTGAGLFDFGGQGHEGSGALISAGPAGPISRISSEDLFGGGLITVSSPSIRAAKLMMHLDLSPLEDAFRGRR
jgi:hypothetical protein